MCRIVAVSLRLLRLSHLLQKCHTIVGCYRKIIKKQCSAKNKRIDVLFNSVLGSKEKYQKPDQCKSAEVRSIFFSQRILFSNNNKIHDINISNQFTK
jgi:hypothetical protein